MKIPKSNLIVFALAAALLVGVAVETWSHPEPGDAEPYHAHVREVADDLPLEFGDYNGKPKWTGRVIPTTKEAIALLKPNTIFTRRFHEKGTGYEASFLLVHCKDARDIHGHYPPICYVAHGYQPDDRLRRRAAEQQQAMAADDIPLDPAAAAAEDAEGGKRPFDFPVTWTRATAGPDGQTDGEEVTIDFTGTEYHFSKGTNRTDRLVVYNFILMPDGTIARDMKQVAKQASDYMRRFFGAAQIQVVFDGAEAQLDPKEQRRIFDELVRAHMPVIEAIRTGAQQDEQ